MNRKGSSDGTLGVSLGYSQLEAERAADRERGCGLGVKGLAWLRGLALHAS